MPSLNYLEVILTYLSGKSKNNPPEAIEESD